MLGAAEPGTASGSYGAARPPIRLYVAGAALVTAWRIAALTELARGSGEQPLGPLRVLLAAVGLSFLICGFVVLRRRADGAGALFAAYCLCAGFHWGGPLELASGQLRTALILLYLVISGLLAEALFLRFALTFPRRAQVLQRRGADLLLFGPVAVAAAAALVFLASPAEDGLRGAAEGLFFGLHALVTNLYALAVLVLYVIYLTRYGTPRGEKRYLAVMVAGMLTAWLPYLVASAVGAETDPWNLSMAALPIAFTVGILGIDGLRRAARAEPEPRR